MVGFFCSARVASISSVTNPLLNQFNFKKDLDPEHRHYVPRNTSSDWVVSKPYNMILHLFSHLFPHL